MSQFRARENFSKYFEYLLVLFRFCIYFQISGWCLYRLLLRYENAYHSFIIRTSFSNFSHKYKHSRNQGLRHFRPFSLLSLDLAKFLKLTNSRNFTDKKVFLEKLLKILRRLIMFLSISSQQFQNSVFSRNKNKRVNH